MASIGEESLGSIPMPELAALQEHLLQVSLVVRASATLPS